jgi:hypothetical protein
MGTRFNALFDHDLPDYRDRELTLARLAPTLPAALAVLDYWKLADPKAPHSDLLYWRPEPESRQMPNLVRYTGPGSLFLTVSQKAARIRGGGRWRGFLTIEHLRRVHLAAIRRIAGAFGAHALALHADCCEVDDFFWGGRSQWDCVELLERMWGPPQCDVEALDPGADVEGLGAFRLWFLEGA